MHSTYSDRHAAACIAEEIAAQRRHDASDCTPADDCPMCREEHDEGECGGPNSCHICDAAAGEDDWRTER